MADAQLKIVEGRALSAQQKKDLLNRLARIEGQLRGVQKLIALADEPEDCDAVAQQMAAARKALAGRVQVSYSARESMPYSTGRKIRLWWSHPNPITKVDFALECRLRSYVLTGVVT